jgi:ribA/ribD-fused uncharacterized protein
MLEITSFKDEYVFLSNFYRAVVTYEDVEYPTSEHAYQAAKTIVPEGRMKILATKKPGQAKREGQLLICRKNWDKLKVGIMTEILKSKFSDPKLMKKLKDTGTAILIEGNYWHDNFWGLCTCDKCSDIIGHNNLGLVLTRIRDGIII